MITTSTELEEFIARAVAHGEHRVAVDTEADSLHSYFEKLCLVQIAVGGEARIIDPLADYSLEPLYSWLAGSTVILQGADFDLRMLRRAGCSGVGDVFDTMIAARLTGRTQFSLAALVEEFFGIKLAKAARKADWSMRPLSAQMEEYAKNDVIYLARIADRLEHELREKNRWEWFRQSCAKAIEQAMVDRERDADEVWRIKGAGSLPPRVGAVLRALWHWRDKEAMAVDRPAFKVMRNEDLIRFAEELERGQHPHIHYLRGDRRARFFKAADEALALPEHEWPRKPRGLRRRNGPEEEKRFESLREKRDAAAAQLHLDPSLIASRWVLEMLSSDPDLAPEHLLPWQRELIGV